MKTVCVCDLNFPLQKRMKTLSVEKLEIRVGYCLKCSADVTTETSLGTENITKCAQENQETTMHKEDKSQPFPHQTNKHMDPNLSCVSYRFFVSKWICHKKKIAQTQANCHLVPCKILCIGLQIIISAHDSSLTYQNLKKH